MMRIFTARWALAALTAFVIYSGALLPTGEVAGTPGGCLAVVVGAGEYSDRGAGGVFAPEDARAVGNALGAHIGTDRILVLAGAEATKNGVARAIESWLDPRENAWDTVVLYFAGHGNSGYFELYGSLPGNPSNDLTAAELAAWLDELESCHVIVVMDFCGCGDFGESLAGEKQSIMTAGTDGEQCWQDAALGHGVFTHYFVEALNQPEEANTDRTRELSITELYTYINQQLKHHFAAFPPPALQRPRLISDGNPAVLTMD